MYQICQSIPLWLQRNATGIGSTEPAAKQLVIRSGRAVPLLHFLMPLNVLLLMLKHVLKEIGHQEMKSLPRKDWTPLWCGFTVKNLKIHSCGFTAKWGRRKETSTGNGLKACTGVHFSLARIFPLQFSFSEFKYKRIKLSAWNPPLTKQWDAGNWL